ncbi:MULTISPECIES: tRNA (adenosine(37)-N6)-dimethylallyltransferase MiaA [unclassified Staphylococcus]|uniref:tRNA (adenosine(37)-N6)-dimethylallyltransferase MiaA n=1 Tax=unclassified Staphylococcus TaxID=91994 RepID=UPI00187FE706|nr:MULTISPECIES: tRNA (adenosine(37)-N6)-dimethylallyltransferase MiaA [unclassified Staphylococcus]MBF2756663.1 tRNA (adenosine(37)-N6)-dimethylallyltransferase MiaA [Staphylococcus haemolyticus]MBF2772718.1 tRNA (adenosine(37)-N6)-dimethylallyltransferase MiaA [Staphylococcus haemolyticus]MBF2775666.1 tRNA (adenosine(37)-N6)-dimethylallyltransferase MiaA [Staphylococcus haemolyticus]MBF2814967.1 tRNA (adenosine(37)-N6)-dimethylallyltransferase MiaA [Staphylococcus haemolyticus]MBF9720228.1 t
MNDVNKPFLVVIVGPTASGKTELSIELAKRINGEIISGDSMQVYKQMDIGTAKVTNEEMDGIPHYMIDILNPDDSFSAYDFKQQAQNLIKDITTRGKVPIIAGGTGLYIQSLIYDYPFEDETVSKEVEKQTKSKLQALEPLTNQEVHDYLATFDPQSAQDIHPNNRKRVYRAIEYYLNTKKLISSRKKVQQFTENYDTLLIGIEMSRKTLYSRINKRVDIMLGHGLFNEVKNLVEQGYESTQSMQAIGYKELVPVVNGELSIDQAVETLKQHSRQYAKRQLTWFKNKLHVQWFDRETMTLQMMLDEITTQINKRSSKHDCKPQHPRSSTREL